MSVRASYAQIGPLGFPDLLSHSVGDSERVLSLGLSQAGEIVASEHCAIGPIKNEVIFQ